ncbi:MAG: DUF3536 domain-containing protein [Elusimicrobia bacterium]|nr:DUF3536 domain-containing protein [Elusimicrobiota bacterium]
MSRYLCIHGHFYQPPRENPWLEEVDPEDSAYPFRDWNTRIFQECYGPNAATPLLNSEGRIEELFNNYEWISFNFGPTLLSWLQRHEPRTYRLLLRADESSRVRCGHGNALAQVYNHVIMPLANPRDKRTQIRWGIEDFKYRFGRIPEGMWLAETAVDEETLEMMVQEGLHFTILSPSQAKTSDLDVTQPYRWFSKKSRDTFLDIFFYHKGLSHAIAFEGLLSDGEKFKHALLSAFNNSASPQLIHVATDGESYGHHHRLGNMALTYALRQIKQEPAIQIVNYATFLEKHPPQKEVEIIPFSAWSCSHGVGRWSEDCGCRIDPQSGWHQRWRKPLRDSLNQLSQKIDLFYEQKGSSLLKDPWLARDHYIQRVADPSPSFTKRFLDQHSSKHLSAEEAVGAVQLLEMQRARLLMFTSCGWFFDEISGLESTQILKYAAHAMELAALADGKTTTHWEKDFKDSLRSCPSNLSSYGDGSIIYEKLVTPCKISLKRAAAHHALEESLGGTPLKNSYAFHYKVREKESAHHRNTRLFLLWLDIHRPATLEKGTFTALVLHQNRSDLNCFLSENPDLSRHRDMGRRTLKTFLETADPEMISLLEKNLGGDSFSREALFKHAKKNWLLLLEPPPGSEELFRQWMDLLHRRDSEKGPEVLRVFKRIQENGLSWNALPFGEMTREMLLHLMERMLHKQQTQELEDIISIYTQLEFPWGLWEFKQLLWEHRQTPGLQKLAEKLNFNLAHFSNETHHDHQKITSA